MAARIHKAMNARIQRAADEGTIEESRRLDRTLGQMRGGWAAESNIGVVLDLLLDDGERTISSHASVFEKRLDRLEAVAHKEAVAYATLTGDDWVMADEESSSPGAVVPSASARTIPHLKVIKIFAKGLAPASSPAARPASAELAQGEASQSEVITAAERELAGMGRIVVRASGTELAGLALERLG